MYPKQNSCFALLLPLSNGTKHIRLLQQVERWGAARIPPRRLYLCSFLLWILVSSGLIWHPGEHARLLYFGGCFANEFLVQGTAVVRAVKDYYIIQLQNPGK